MNFLKNLKADEEGITTVELIFKEQLLSLVDNIFDTITKGAGEISA